MAEEMIPDGFSDEDMEKPQLAVPSQSAAVPLVLSNTDEHPTVQVPATINRYLRDYQREGVRFLYQHFVQDGGAILGDDMGLGKTVQVISFMAAVLGKTGTKADIFRKFIQKPTSQDAHVKGTFLIVSPGSVLYNWKEELETWGYFRQDLFHGTSKAGALERAKKGNLDVVLTTYETLRNHVSELNKVHWSCVIMDEAHRLKEPKAQVTKAAKALKTRIRIGLTGTPLQNRLLEFWCVLDWANPGSLGNSKRFDAEFGKAIRRGQRFDSTKRELAQGRKKSKELQDKLRETFLRRTKALIADQLPQKDEKVVFCPLTSLQEDIYLTILQTPDVLLIRKKNCPCDCGSGEDRGHCCYTGNEEGENIKKLMLRYLQLLLKVANHVALLMPEVKQTEDQQRRVGAVPAEDWVRINNRKRARLICDKVFARYPEFLENGELSSFEVLSDPKFCGKMKVVDKLLKAFQEEKAKVLLFSRSTQLLNILEEYLIGRGLVYRRLDGKTRSAARTHVVRDFNNDPDVFACLVSTKAGGLGLNFTGANVVVIFDPTWNPSSDLQAQDRAYRIGQRRDVRVYRLISAGTIEEMMYLRQVYKQQIANIAVGGTNERRYFTGVDGDKESRGELFGFENLFSYRADGANLAKDIISRTEKVEAGYRVAKYEPPAGEEDRDDASGQKDRRKATALAGQDVGMYYVASQLMESDDTDSERSEDDKSGMDSSALDGPTEATRLGEFPARRHRAGTPGTSKASPVLKKDAKNRAGEESGDGGYDQGKDSSDRGSSSELEFQSSGADDETDEPSPQPVRKAHFTRVKGGRGRSAGNVPGEARRAEPRSPAALEQDDEATSDEASVGEGSSADVALKTRRTVTAQRKGSGRSREVCRNLSSADSDRERRRRPTKGKDNVDKLLESCGVSYTHANSVVVGSSAAENRMSNRALRDVFELQQFSQQPANCYAFTEVSDESDDIGDITSELQFDDQKEPPGTDCHLSSRPRGREAATHKVGDSLVFVGSTPRTIRHRHFGELVSFHGFGSATEFAENVLQSSKEEQREILKQFYVKQNSALASLDVFMRPDAQGGSNGGGNRERRKRGKNKKGVASNWKRHRRRGPAPVHSGRAEAGATSPSSDSRDSGFRPVRGAVGRRRRASGLDSVSGFGFGTADGGVDKLDEPPSGSASNDSDIPDLDATKALDMGLHEVAHDKSTVESKTGAESGLDSAESIVEDFEFRARLRSLNRIENSTAQSCSADVAEAFSCSHFSCNTNSRHKSYAASLLQEFIPTGNEPCAELTGNRDEIFGDARLSHTAHVDLSTQTREEIAQATREVCVAGTRGPIKHEDIVGRKCAALRTSILDELI